MKNSPKVKFNSKPSPSTRQIFVSISKGYITDTLQGHMAKTLTLDCFMEEKWLIDQVHKPIESQFTILNNSATMATPKGFQTLNTYNISLANFYRSNTFEYL